MNTFPLLEQTILKAKGLTDDQLAFLNSAGVASKADFVTIGSAETLAEIMPALEIDVARKVMDWAVGHAAAVAVDAPNSTSKVIIDSADISYCLHC